MKQISQILTVFILMIALLSTTGKAQSQSSSSKTILNGFAKKIEGKDFNYHSSISIAKECLIVRATTGKSSMEWETAPVPSNINDKFVTFAWLAGIGSSPGSAKFNVEVNGIKKFSFWTDGKNQWENKSDDGYVLSFQQEMIDRSGDLFGFMYLKVPTTFIKEGETLRIKITGGEFEKESWYMTFKFPLESGLKFNAYPALITKDGKEKQLGVAGILHFGNPLNAKIYIDGSLLKEAPIKFGYNYIKLALPKVEKEKQVSYKLVAGDYTDEGKITLSPVRKWQVNFVQHSHTDIGYTRSQTEILGEHLRYIDYALDYCDMTDDYPEEAKFRWTCEAMWPVNEYLRSRPAAQIERLKKRVMEKRIEIAGMYFNFDELPDEQILAASLQPLKKIREAGLEVKMAMQNDVNGIGWCLNDYYSDLGIKYLNMGTHGHRALISFDKPTLFWWESPSGNKMLAYRAEHYMTGNFFEIHEEDFNAFEEKILTYLTDLKNKGYEYNLISIQHSGYFTDNSPPSTRASDMIKKWNKKYNWPKLKTATATEFFEEMEAEHGAEFQTIRGAWPDWWTDGFGASAREVATTRRAQTDLIANKSGLSMAAILGSDLPEAINDRIYWANNALLFYTEHTVGYHGSVREPYHKYTMEQRALKESYAWEAGRRSKMIGEEALGLLQSHVEREKEPSLVVFNSLNWERSGLVTAYIDHQLVPRYKKFSLVDENGNKAKAQAVETHSDGTYWAIWVDQIPAFGYKKYIIVRSENEATKSEEVTEISQIENQWYKVKIDSERAAISSLFDKDLNKELVDPDAKWKLGEFIYETLGNRSQMEEFHLDDYKRDPLDKVSFERYEEGEIWNTVYFRGNTEAAIKDGSYEFEIRLFNTTKRIDLAYSILKKLVTDPEGIYIAFPFQFDEGVSSFDVQGGEIRAGIDQIPGSANDWNVVQNYTRIHSDKGQILLSSPEIPMMQFGAINTGRYKAGATPESTHIYGWPMNNYWTTNFNAEQHGGINWVYNISSSPNESQTEATRFGWNNRVPFLARVLPGGGKGEKSWQKSIIQNWPKNVILVSSTPDKNGNSCILHIRETAGKPANLKTLKLADSKKATLKQVNVLGDEITDGSIEFKPFEAKFIKLSW
jgi:alpha-mannosidase